MRPQDKQIKLAEAFELSKLAPLRYATRRGKLLNLGEKGVRVMYCSGSKGGWQDWDDVPDYLNSLDAVQTLKDKLTFHQQTDCVAALMRSYKDFPMTSAFFASASEWCEAIAEVLKLWGKDDDFC